MLTFPIGLLSNKVEGEKILITITPTALFTAGINLTFASGTLTIDWKDGSGTENFVSGVELTHEYTDAGTNIAEITGDLTNITKFFADNSRITFISNLTTGLLTDFRINNNLYSGNLDMSLAPVSVRFYAYSNTSLSSITFASSGNGQLTDTRVYSCTNLTSFNLTNVTISTRLELYNNTSMSSLTFASSGNGVLNYFQFYNTGLTGVVDLSNMPISTTLRANANSGITGFTFASSGNGTMTSFNCNSCNITSLDLTNVPVSGLFYFYSNTNLTSITFAASGNGVLTNFRVQSCSLPNIDFSAFPTSDNVSIFVFSNSFTATEHDNQLINLDGEGWVNGTLQIITGNTARTAASDAAHANLLVNGWTIT